MSEVYQKDNPEGIKKTPTSIDDFLSYKDIQKELEVPKWIDVFGWVVMRDPFFGMKVRQQKIRMVQQNYDLIKQMEPKETLESITTPEMARTMAYTPEATPEPYSAPMEEPITALMPTGKRKLNWSKLSTMPIERAVDVKEKFEKLQPEEKIFHGPPGTKFFKQDPETGEMKPYFTIPEKEVVEKPKEYEPHQFVDPTGQIQWVKPGEKVPAGWRPYQKPKEAGEPKEVSEEPKSATDKLLRDALARKYLNTPAIWGGKTPRVLNLEEVYTQLHDYQRTAFDRIVGLAHKHVKKYGVEESLNRAIRESGATTTTTPKAEGEKQLDEATARAILKEAKGNKEEARKVARKRGYKF